MDVDTNGASPGPSHGDGKKGQVDSIVKCMSSELFCHLFVAMVSCESVVHDRAALAAMHACSAAGWLHSSQRPPPPCRLLHITGR